MFDSYQTEKSAPADRFSAGPYDSSELQASGYLDFGAISLPTKDGLQVHLEVEDRTQRVIAVTVDYDDSSLQLQAFAAPKSEGLWHSVRRQIAEAAASQEGIAETRIGSLGPELLTKIPLLNDSGSVIGTRFARFIGVDGPKWFLRGMVSGAAITDPKAAAEIDDIFRSAIIHRDTTPLPPGDLLPLHLPGNSEVTSASIKGF